MYCYNCGKMIYNGVKKCPCCEMEIDHSEINEIVLQNTWAHISETCPTIEKPHRKIFNIGEKQIIISGDYYIFAYINVFINYLRNQIVGEFSKYYDSCDFDSLVKTGEGWLRKNFRNVGNAILGFKYKNSGHITRDDQMTIAQMVQSSEYIWSTIYSIAEEFDDLKSELAARRQVMHIDRKDYWVGGGFGVSGAIKGKIQADILNAGASIKNSVANFASQAIQAGIDRSKIEKLKKEIKNNPELKEILLKAVEKFFADCTSFLVDIYLENREKFEKIEMLDKRKFTYAEALSVLNDNPYNISAYSSIYYHDPQAGESLSKMAQFLGVEDFVYAVLRLADGALFEEGKLDLHSIGFDTEVTELKRIKSVLLELEKNNPGYVCDLENENTRKEQRYHRKVDELLALNHIGECEKLVEKTFNENSFKDSVLLLIKYNDAAINNLLFNRLMGALKQEGGRAIINEFGKDLPAFVADALIVHWYQTDRSKYEKMIQNAVKMGRVFPTAYYGAYCYNSKSGDLKAEGIKNLIWAANRNCDLAMLYVGRFYKNGINGMYYDREIADSYFRISAALGDDSAKDEMKK